MDRVKELKGDNDYEESESEEEDLLIGTLPPNIPDQEFPPDSIEDYASDDDVSPIDHPVRLHKLSIKRAEGFLKKEKELLVRFVGGEVVEEEYVEGVEWGEIERREDGCRL